MIKLILRDGHAQINGDKTVYKFDSGNIDIVAEDGRTLFGISIGRGGVLHIGGGDVCKHEGKLLEDKFRIAPVASNCVDLVKPEYREPRLPPKTQPKERK